MKRRMFTVEEVAALDLRRQKQIERQKEIINRLLAQIEADDPLPALLDHYTAKLEALGKLVDNWRLATADPEVFTACADELEAVLDGED